METLCLLLSDSHLANKITCETVMGRKASTSQNEPMVNTQTDALFSLLQLASTYLETHFCALHSL